MRPLAAMFAVLLAILPLAHVPALRDALALAVTLGIAVMVARERRVPLPAWPMAAWCGLAIASLLWSVDREGTLHALLYAMLLPAGVFLAAWRVARQRGSFRYLHGAVLVSAVPLVVMAIAALASGHFNELQPEVEAGGMLHYWPGVGVASTFACLIAPFALLLATTSVGWRRAAGWLLLVALVAVAAATLNRIVWPALLASALAFAAWLWPTLGAMSRRVAAVTLVVAAGVAWTAFQYANEERYPERQDLEAVEKDVRLQGWRTWLAIVGEAPLLGHGFGRAAVQASIQGRLSAPLVQLQLGAHGHNVLLDVSVELGLVGLLLYCAILAALLREFGRLGGKGAPRDVLALGAAGGSLLVAMLAKNSTDDFMQQAVLLAFWAYAGLILGGLEASASRRTMPLTQTVGLA